jgi:hypothetical protein
MSADRIIGVLEHWSIGALRDKIIKTFQHSNIPTLQHSSNLRVPHGVS